MRFDHVMNPIPHIGIRSHGLDYTHSAWAEGAHWDGEKWVGELANCHIAHSFFDGDGYTMLSFTTVMKSWQDCPVASRWTLLRGR